MLQARDSLLRRTSVMNAALLASWISLGQYAKAQTFESSRTNPVVTLPAGGLHRSGPVLVLGGVEEPRPASIVMQASGPIINGQTETLLPPANRPIAQPIAQPIIQAQPVVPAAAGEILAQRTAPQTRTILEPSPTERPRPDAVDRPKETPDLQRRPEAIAKQNQNAPGEREPARRTPAQKNAAFRQIDHP